MEPEQTSQELEVNVESNQSVLNTVTPLSKYLAMALFVLLPFVGGYIGYTFVPEKIVEVEKQISLEKETDSEQKADIEISNDEELLVLLSKEQISGGSYIGYNSPGVDKALVEQVPETDAFYGYNRNQYLAAIGDHLVFLVDGNGTDAYLVFFNVVTNEWGSHFIREPANRNGPLYFYNDGTRKSKNAKLFNFAEGRNSIFDLGNLPEITEREVTELPILEFPHWNIYIDKSISASERRTSPVFVFDTESGLERWRYVLQSNSFVKEQN